MEESILSITEEMHARLKRILARKSFGKPPEAMRKERKSDILIGEATREQRAIALLYCEIGKKHVRRHKIGRLPFGVNPYVGSAHYRDHVMLPVLYEMLQWSVHRSHPERKSDLSIRFDEKWNMYGLPRKPKKKKK